MKKNPYIIDKGQGIKIKTFRKKRLPFRQEKSRKIMKADGLDVNMINVGEC